MDQGHKKRNRLLETLNHPETQARLEPTLKAALTPTGALGAGRHRPAGHFVTRGVVCTAAPSLRAPQKTFAYDTKPHNRIE